MQFWCGVIVASRRCRLSLEAGAADSGEPHNRPGLRGGYPNGNLPVFGTVAVGDATSLAEVLGAFPVKAV